MAKRVLAVGTVLPPDEVLHHPTVTKVIRLKVLDDAHVLHASRTVTARFLDQKAVVAIYLEDCLMQAAEIIEQDWR